jgi:hypothetical protein
VSTRSRANKSTKVYVAEHAAPTPWILGEMPLKNAEPSRQFRPPGFVVAWVMGIGVAGLLFAVPAWAERPAPSGKYVGFHAAAIEGPDEGFLSVTGELRVSRSGRSVAPTTLTFFCNEYEAAVRLSGKSGKRSAVAIGRDGRFAAQGRRGAARYRLRGRFLTRGLARIGYAERLPSGRRGCRSTMKLYRNGVPPFSGCRSQRAATHVWGETGRVFQQYTLHNTGEYFTHVYACLFDSPSRRVDLGRNYDDERLGTFRLAGPFVAYFTGGCATCVFDQRGIGLRDLRDGSHVTRPGGSANTWGTRLYDLELKANSSFAWTQDRIAIGPDGFPAGYPGPPVVEAHEVWASDSQGRRLVESDLDIDLNSLDLNESTLNWINGGTPHSATLD